MAELKLGALAECEHCGKEIQCIRISAATFKGLRWLHKNRIHMPPEFGDHWEYSRECKTTYAAPEPEEATKPKFKWGDKVRWRTESPAIKGYIALAGYANDGVHTVGGVKNGDIKISRGWFDEWFFAPADEPETKDEQDGAVSELWTVEEVAEYLGVELGFVRKLVYRQVIPWYRRDGLLYCIKADLLEWMKGYHAK